MRVITIGDDEKLVGHTKAIVSELRGKMARVEGDFGAEPIKAKIQNAEQSRVHTMLVLGTRELENDSVAIRLHGKGNVGTKPTSDAIAGIVAAIAERRPNPAHEAPAAKA